MKHKKLLLFFVVFSLLVAGCGRKEETSPSEIAESKTPAAVPETTVVEATTPEEVKEETSGLATDLAAAAAPDKAVLTDGLVATLQLAAERAVEGLSAPGGFSENEALRLQLPKSFEPVESALEKMGQQDLVNSLTDSMNEAARKSIAASPEILGQAISAMKVQDALSIFNGGEDAATRYLEKNTRALIEEKMMPIISQQIEAAGSTRYFNQIVDLVSQQKEGLMGSLASMTGVSIPTDFKLDRYIADNALDGLFTRLAEEEAKIRENPAARTSELVKSAFELLRKGS
ncbi:MAG: DUF4197 domain-containing protein [Oceanipulchritudo sp.]